MGLISPAHQGAGTATLLVTHDLVHRNALDELVTVVDGAVRGKEVVA